MTKGELAKNYYKQGLNCAQAVALAFEKELGLDSEVIKKFICGFGGGFGRQGLVCGAVSAMTMVLSYLAPSNATKLEVYEIIKKACGEVKTQLGDLNCVAIKSQNKTSCDNICKIVAETVEKYING